MPPPLLARCRPHSINEFRAAAFQRYADAEALLREERRTAAVYLLGYAAEMVLKAGWFAAQGYHADAVITVAAINTARHVAPSLGVTWTGNMHNVAAWGDLLVRFRTATPGLAYADPVFASEVTARSARIYRTWRETLRYHKNVAYAHEVREVRGSVEWFLAHHRAL